MVDVYVSDKFKKTLMDFILDCLSSVKKLTTTSMTDSEYAWVVKYRRFKYCFQDLYKLDCNYCDLLHKNSYT